jgi:hypothetical protein
MSGNYTYKKGGGKGGPEKKNAPSKTTAVVVKPDITKPKRQGTLRSAKQQAIVSVKNPIISKLKKNAIVGIANNPLDKIVEVYIQNGYDKEKANKDYKFISAVDYYHDGIKGDRLTAEQKKLNETLLDTYLYGDNATRIADFQSRDVNISDLERKTQTYFERVLSKSLDGSKKNGRSSNILDIGKIFDKKGNLLINPTDNIFNENHITIEYNSNTNPRSITNNALQKKYFKGLKTIFDMIVGKGTDISKNNILINVDAKYDPIIFAMFEDNIYAKQIITPANSLDSGFVTNGFNTEGKTIYYAEDNYIQKSNFLTIPNRYQFIVQKDTFAEKKMTGYKWILQKPGKQNIIEPTSKQINGPSIQTLSSYIECANKGKTKECFKSIDKNSNNQISLLNFLLDTPNELKSKLCFDVKHMGDFEQINYLYNFAMNNKDYIIINLTGDINCATYSNLLQSFITILSTPNSFQISVGKPVKIMREIDKEIILLRNNTKELISTLEINKILNNIVVTLDGKKGDLIILYESIIHNIKDWGKEEAGKPAQTLENKLLILLIKLKAIDIAFTIMAIQNIMLANKEIIFSINKSLVDTYNVYTGSKGDDYDFNNLDKIFDSYFKNFSEKNLESIKKINVFISRQLEFIRTSNKNIQYLFELFYKTNRYDKIKSKKFRYEIKPNMFFIKKGTEYEYITKLPQFDFNIEDIKDIIKELSIFEKYKNSLKTNYQSSINNYLSKFMIFKMADIRLLPELELAESRVFSKLEILEGYNIKTKKIIDSRIYREMDESISKDSKENKFYGIISYLDILIQKLLIEKFQINYGGNNLLTPVSSPQEKVEETNTSNTTVSLPEANEVSSNFNTTSFTILASKLDDTINKSVGEEIMKEFKRSTEQVAYILYNIFTNKDDDTPEYTFDKELILEDNPPPNEAIFNIKLIKSITFGGDGLNPDDEYVNEEYESIKGSINNLNIAIEEINILNTETLDRLVYLYDNILDNRSFINLLNEYDLKSYYIISNLLMYSQDAIYIKEKIAEMKLHFKKMIPKSLKNKILQQIKGHKKLITSSKKRGFNTITKKLHKIRKNLNNFLKQKKRATIKIKPKNNL